MYNLDRKEDIDRTVDGVYLESAIESDYCHKG